MKRFSAFVLVCVLCFSALLTGCTDIWEGIVDDERVYEFDAYDFPHGFDHIKVKKDNTVEIYGDVDGDWCEVSFLSFWGDEDYSSYKAEYNYRDIAYGTYKQIGDRLKIKFDYFLIMEVRGDDAEAFKSAYIKNRPEDAEIFGKGVNRYDDYKSADLVVSVKNNECKALEYKWKDANNDNMTWSYYDSGEIKSQKYTCINWRRLDGSETLKYITKFDIDGSFNRFSYVDGVIFSYEEYDSKGLINKKYGYDFDGKQDTTTLYEYDSNDNLIAEKEYDSNDVLVSRKEREYDQNGKFTAEREYDSDGRLVSEDIQYDSMSTKYDWEGGKHNRKVVEVYDSNGEIMLKLEYIYDSDGRITLKREYNSNNELVNETRYDD